MKGLHTYNAVIKWTGNNGTGTTDYNSYSRNHTISFRGKADIEGSADPAFRGDAVLHNPEELLLGALSSCHMLAYLHLCATNGVIVTAYSDEATADMTETPDGGGHFISATLHPNVTIPDVSMREKCLAFHHRAHESCFIANSVNFPVKTVPSVKIEGVE